MFRTELAKLAVIGALAAAPAHAADAPRLVVLTQTGCQFLESEKGVDHGYAPDSKSDCERINAEDGESRLSEADVLVLEPGRYVFRVTNTDVPYELGFWLRERDYDRRNPVHKLTRVSVSGGGILEGQTREYAVELEPGEYLYSCPLNPTPDYRLVVR